MKTTPWFSAIYKPKRKGWYQARGIFYETEGNPRELVWRYWTGKRWMWRSPLSGRMEAAAVSPTCNDQWRGLVTPNVGAKLTARQRGSA
jgi:hypothetical protein